MAGKNDELLMRLLGLKLHDFFLAYGSMRVFLEEVLENSDDLQENVFEHMADHTAGMLSIGDEQLVGMIEEAADEDEAHEIIDNFINDLIAPIQLIVSRYLAPEETKDYLEAIHSKASDMLHERTSDFFVIEDEDEELPAVTN